MQESPRYDDVVDEVESFFVARMAALVRNGLPENRIVLDPGIGFGKNLEHNLALLRSIGRFLRLGRPLLLGISHKSFLGAMLDLAEPDRGQATQVGIALAAVRGVIHHRVHDVAAARRTLAQVREWGPRREADAEG
jgi:dihydropteroate synthase